MSTKTNPVDLVIKALGSPTKASTALGLSGSNVISMWRLRGQVPADKVLQVEAVSGVSRHVLRPDIFGDAPAVSA